MPRFSTSRIAAVALVTVAASSLLSASAQQLTPTEKKIVTAINAQNEANTAFLKELVNVNSGTLNTAGVRQIADMLRPRFEALGFTVHWVPMDAVHRAGHLIAEHPEPGGKRMLLIGHLDTVFEKSSQFQAWQQSGNKATGPGSSDIKGGDMVMLAALDAMQSAGVLKNASITVVLTGDEERPGDPVSIGRRDLITAAKASDVALDFEGGSTRNGVDYGSTSRRSSLMWTLKATGTTGHSSGIFNPAIGYGAIYEIARCINDFRQQLPETGLTFNIGFVAGGADVTVDPDGASGKFAGKTNIIPPVAYASGDIRTVSDEQTQRVEGKMRAIVQAHLAKTDATIEFQEGYPAMGATPGNKALLTLLNGVNRDAGFPQMQELDPLQRGAGDISFISRYDDSLAGLGSIGGNAHREGEYVELDHQPVQAKRAALLMYRLSKLERSALLAQTH